MKLKKGFLLIVLVLVLMLAVPLMASANEEVLATGNLTETITYTLYADQRLVIDGMGMLSSHDELYGALASHLPNVISIEIGEGITGLDYFYFYDFNQLKTISLPSTLKEINQHDFGNCGNLETVILTEGLERIEKDAFMNDWNITSITIPASVKIIEEEAFVGCNNLSEVIFLGAPPELGETTFYKYDVAAQLTAYYPENAGWTQEDLGYFGCAIIWIPYTLDGQGNLVTDESRAYTAQFAHKTAGKIGDTGSWYIDSENVLHIEGTGFVEPNALCEEYWKDIQGLVVEPGITGMRYYFYEPFTKLETVKFTDALDLYPSIYRCVALESIDFGAAACKISEIYELPSIRQVVIPASVTEIGYETFFNCKNLETVVFQGSAPAEIWEKSFAKVGEVTVYYPAGDPSWTEDVMRRACGATGTWIPYTLDNAGNRIPDPSQAKTFVGIADSEQQNDTRWTLYSDGLMRIEGAGTHVGNHGSNSIYADVRRVEFGDGITGLGKNAFAWCKYITEITLPEGLVELGEYAFGQCFSLASIQIPGSVKTISDFAFVECTRLSSVTLNEGLQYVGESAFRFAPIQEIVIPSTVLDVDESAFSDCKLENVIILTDQLTRISDACFANNPIRTFIVPEGVNSIERAAFWGCENLGVVVFEGPLPAFGENVFTGAGEPMVACQQAYADSISEQWLKDMLLSGPIVYTIDEAGNFVTEEWNVGDLDDKIEQAKAKYPEGYSLGIYSVSKLDAGAQVGYGSQAFAYILSDMLFEGLPAELDTDVVFDDVQVGDILRLPGASQTDSGRAVVVIGRNGDALTVAQGDWRETPDAPGTVHWGETLNREQVESSEYRITRYTRNLLSDIGKLPSYEPEWPSIDGDITEDAVYDLILSLKGSYPEGFPYSTDITYTSVAEDGGILLTGMGCSAFAYRISDLAFGAVPMRYVTDIDYDDIMVGDILHYDPDPYDDTTHVVIAMEVYQDCIVTVEANYGETVHWGGIFQKEEVENMLGYYTRYAEGTPHEEREEYIKHTWQDATCETPRTCTDCGITRGEPLGHKWAEATCASSMTCSVCKKTEGQPLKHVYVDGICSRCGAEERNRILGDANGDGKVDYKDAMLVLRASVNLEKLDEDGKIAGDVDGNGKLDYKDAMKILRASVGLEEL